MEDGEEGATLLDWLNSLPEVQATLKENFKGVPISKQNVSEWRQGGFREWQIRKELLEQACHLSAGASEMEEAVDTESLPGALAGVLAARYAAVLNTWGGGPEERIEAKLLLLRGMNRDIALLQRTMQLASQQQRELEQSLERKHRREAQEMKSHTLDMLMCGQEREALRAVLGGAERHQKLAELIAAVEYDLPCPTHRAKLKPAGQTESKPVKSCPAESSPDEVSQLEASPVKASPKESDAVKPAQATSKQGDLGDIQSIHLERGSCSPPRSDGSTDCPCRVAALSSGPIT
jgi:hypothetical protein